MSDLDNDGDLDAVTANRLTGDVSVLLGNGDGTLATAVEYSVGAIVRDVVVADVDPDGIPDIVTANREALPIGEGDIRATPGRGDGTFVSPMTIAAERGGPTNRWQLEVADMDDDGFSDLFTFSTSTSTLVTYFGDGAGSLSKGPVITFSSSYIFDAAVGDLNGDGDPDLAILDYVTEQLVVGLGVGDGTFQSYAFYAPTSAPGEDVHRLAFADLDADEKPDVVVGVHDGTVFPETASLTLFFGTGDGSLAGSPTVLPIDSALLNALITPIVSPVAGDFDGDGILDLAAVFGGGDDGALFIGTGGGSFAAGVPITYPNSASGRGPVGAQDLDGDGADELVYWQCSQSSSQLCRFGVLSGPDLGTVLYESAESRLAATELADMNGDGVLDVLMFPAGLWPEIGVALGAANGTFEPKMNFHTGMSIPHDDAAAIDVDRDGILDVVDFNTGNDARLIILPNLTGE